MRALRVFVAAWYLFGWMSHVYFGLVIPRIYAPFGDTALIPGFRAFWHMAVMPHITACALALAAFEMAVGCLLLLGRDRWFEAGLVLSILFNLFLVQMGLGYPAATPWMDFLANRAANLLFIALQIPLVRLAFAPASPVPSGGK
jgi:hypothetical protein